MLSVTKLFLHVFSFSILYPVFSCLIFYSFPQVNEEEASLFDVLWLLLASVIFVPIFQKIPGGK